MSPVLLRVTFWRDQQKMTTKRGGPLDLPPVRFMCYGNIPGALVAQAAWYSTGPVYARDSSAIECPETMGARAKKLWWEKPAASALSLTEFRSRVYFERFGLPRRRRSSRKRFLLLTSSKGGSSPQNASNPEL